MLFLTVAGVALYKARLCVSPRGEVRAELRRKDLGLDQHWGGGSPPNFAFERVRQGQGRLDRLARLALPWRVRCQVVSAGGVSALMYGAAVAALSGTAITTLRRRVVLPILGMHFRAAIEAVFALLDVARCCDVLAVALEPWRGHVLVQRTGGSQMLCLRCGVAARTGSAALPPRR